MRSHRAALAWVPGVDRQTPVDSVVAVVGNGKCAAVGCHPDAVASADDCWLD